MWALRKSLREALISQPLAFRGSWMLRLQRASCDPSPPTTVGILTTYYWSRSGTMTEHPVPSPVLPLGIARPGFREERMLSGHHTQHENQALEKEEEEEEEKGIPSSRDHMHTDVGESLP
eukprot:bmy_17426T0